jgi:stress response protein YsnF
MDSPEQEFVVPVVQEEVHADSLPVETGSVRVTKNVIPHEEILEQELRKGRVEVKRVKADRIVDGPQQVFRSGNTLVVPVVTEVLRVEKQWVVTEEIHITQIEERETVQQTVVVNEEQAVVERLDASGEVVGTIAESSAPSRSARLAPPSLVNKTERAAPAAADSSRVLGPKRSILRDRAVDPERRR